MRLSIILLLFLVTACSNGTKHSESSSPSSSTENWPGKMRNAAESFQDLLPYIYDEEKFSAKKNRNTVHKKIARFAGSIHSIQDDSARKILGDDPYVLQSLSQLKDFTERAKTYYAKEDFRHSRILLKATTNTCFKCHTRLKYGPESYYWKNFDVSNIKTNALEKAQIMVSMRKYQEAKLYLRQHITELESSGNYNLPYEAAIKNYLMISLRGQNNLKPSHDFVQSKILVAKVPTEFHYTLKHWQKDLKYWMNNRKALQPTLNSARTVLKRNKKSNTDRNAINNLIAGTLLHNFLMNPKNVKSKAEAYYLLGNIYDSLILAGYWDLPEVYYEMCIKYSPKTPIAKKCYKRYRENIVVGYSGSRGTLIPQTEYDRLEKLKKEAGL